MQNILVLGAHYDDAELGAGGTMAKLVSENKNVYKLTLTDNETHFNQMNIHVDSSSSASQSSNACKIMGVTEILDINPIECNNLKYSTELMQKVEAIIFDKKIDTVIMHHTDDMNQDHVVASQLSLTAARHCDNILLYQSNGYILNKPFIPDYFIDVSEFIGIKRKALEQYGNEHNRFDKLFELSIERCHIWGYANKCEYAEGFKLIKMLQQ